MPSRSGIQKALVLAAFLAVATALLFRVYWKWSSGPGGSGIVPWKFSNCFVNRSGLLAIVGAGALSLLIGYQAIKEVFTRIAPGLFAKLILAIAGVNGLVGLTVLGPFKLPHGLVGWRSSDYLKVMIPSFLLSAACTTLAVLFVARSEPIPRIRALRTLGLVGVLLVTGYLFASVVYMNSFTPVAVE